MVLVFLAEVALESSWWAIKQTYNLGHYMMYGQQESKEDKILRQVEELRKELELEREQLKMMKTESYLQYRKTVKESKMDEMPISENIYDNLSEENE